MAGGAAALRAIVGHVGAILPAVFYVFVVPVI